MAQWHDEDSGLTRNQYEYVRGLREVCRGEVVEPGKPLPQDIKDRVQRRLAEDDWKVQRQQDRMKKGLPLDMPSE